MTEATDPEGVHTVRTPSVEGSGRSSSSSVLCNRARERDRIPRCEFRLPDELPFAVLEDFGFAVDVFMRHLPLTEATHARQRQIATECARLPIRSAMTTIVIIPKGSTKAFEDPRKVGTSP